MRTFAVVCLLSGIFAPGIFAQQDSIPAPRFPTPPKSSCRVAAHEEENQKKRHNYTYEEKVIEKKTGRAR